MAATRLDAHSVGKPWGCAELLPAFEAFETGEPIGEIWFDQSDDAELLIKYLFTSEKLSVQVHPDDDAAQAAGYPRGKDEAWLILDAAPDSTIALGPKNPMSPHQMRAAAIDGSIVDLLDWVPVKAGDFIYSPAGTIHAIGAGLTLIEIQQNLDLTYRLYDYGRPRELHLEEGAAVSVLSPFSPPSAPENRGLLAEGPKFVVERLEESERRLQAHSMALLAAVSGTGRVDGLPFAAGECWAISGEVDISLSEESTALLAYPGARRF